MSWVLDIDIELWICINLVFNHILQEGWIELGEISVVLHFGSDLLDHDVAEHGEMSVSLAPVLNRFVVGFVVSINLLDDLLDAAVDELVNLLGFIFNERQVLLGVRLSDLSSLSSSLGDD